MGGERGTGAFFDRGSPLATSKLLRSLTTTEWIAWSLNMGYKGRNWWSCDLFDYASLLRASIKFLDLGWKSRSSGLYAESLRSIALL